jgi:hypothetical protein
VAYSFHTAAGTATGTVRELVVKDTLNPFGAGDLTFIYQVQVKTIDIGGISGASDFGTKLDVGQTAGPPSLPTGTGTSLFANRNLDGDTFRFTFVPDVGPGRTSFAQVVRTNSRMITTGTIGLIDGGGTTLPGVACSRAVAY